MRSALPFVLALFEVFCQPAMAGNVVVAWGGSDSGQTNVPPSATNVIAIAAGYKHSLALKSDGKVLGWGSAPASVPPATLSNVVAIAAGIGQSLALTSNGTVVAWGAPRSPSYTNVPPGLSNAVAIACGDEHNLVLKANGTVVAWGENYSGQTNIPADLSNVVAIVAGNSASLAIRSDGTAWGSGGFTNILKKFSSITSGALVANGEYQGAALLGDGTARAWGYAGGTNLITISNAVAVVGRSGFNQAGAVWALQRNGTLAGLGDSYLGQTNVYLNLSNVLSVAIGYTHHMAIVGDSLPMPIASAVSFSFKDGRFTLAQPTVRGRSYRLEHTAVLAGSDWQLLPPVPGDGTVRTLTDPQASAPQRFYRVYGGQ
jgi:alpha-tubulin suppressor-like RCC1 family protein